MKKYLFASLFAGAALLTLSSCQSGKEAVYYNNADFDGGKLFFSAKTYIKDKLSDTVKVGFNYAREDGYEPTDAYSIYYYIPDKAFGVVMDLPSDFATNKDYIVSYYREYTMYDGESMRCDFEFNTKYKTLYLERETYFPEESGSTFFVMDKTGRTEAYESSESIYNSDSMFACLYYTTTEKNFQITF